MDTEQFSTYLPEPVAEQVHTIKDANGYNKSEIIQRLVETGLEARDEPQHSFPSRFEPIDTVINVLLLAAVLATPFGAAGLYATTSDAFAAWSVFVPFGIIGPMWGLAAIGLMVYRHRQMTGAGDDE